MLHMGALWVDGKLPRHCAACLSSFVSHGHPLTLFSYALTDAPPAGIVVEDARAIVPERICAEFAQFGRYAQFANYFRYRLLASRPGICWVDTDLYCLRPITAEEYIFGWQNADEINSAILALPPDSPVLAKLLQMFEDKRFVPSWLANSGRGVHIRARAAIGFPISKVHYPWGSLGPEAVTHYLKSAGLDGFAKPVAQFYPLHWSRIDSLFDPAFDWNGGILRSAVTLHLWNEILRKHPRFNHPEPGSLLWKIIQGERIGGDAA